METEMDERENLFPQHGAATRLKVGVMGGASVEFDDECLRSARDLGSAIASAGAVTGSTDGDVWDVIAIDVTDSRDRGTEEVAVLERACEAALCARYRLVRPDGALGSKKEDPYCAAVGRLQ